MPANTASDEPAEQISLRLPAWMLADLDSRARRLGESRSTLIRTALRRLLTGETSPDPVSAQ